MKLKSSLITPTDGIQWKSLQLYLVSWKDPSETESAEENELELEPTKMEEEGLLASKENGAEQTQSDQGISGLGGL